MMSTNKYPVFRNPRKYLATRAGSLPLLRRLHVDGETLALNRCLAGLEDISTVCDVPSGPGRLFGYWQRRGWEVVALDFSPQMVEAARQAHEEAGLDGSVGQADAFALGDSGTSCADLVASVRFIYYFERSRRIDLLRSLAAASRRYVLVQYKTSESLKGQGNLLRRRMRGQKGHQKWRFLSNGEILGEIEEAGLRPLRLVAAGELSDRVFVLAEKRGTAKPICRVRTDFRTLKPLHRRLAFGLILMLALVYSQNMAERSFWGENEATLALGARSVLQGHWVVPMLSADVPLGQPPLNAWWGALVSGALGGVGEGAIRLANMLPLLAVLALVYHFSARRLNPWVGLMAMAVLGTSYEFWENAAEANANAPLVLFMLVAWAALYALLAESFSRRRWLLFWGALALALLSAGITAPLLTVPVALVYGLLRFGPRRVGTELWRRLRPATGMILMATPVLIWTLLLMREGQASVLRDVLAEEPLLGLHDIGHNEKAWYYYLTELPVNMLPWSIILPILLVWPVARRWRLRKAQPTERVPGILSWKPAHTFALATVFSVLAVLSLAPHKRDTHLLPIMPWVSLLLGHVLWRILLYLSPMNDECDANGEGEGRWCGGLLYGLRAGRALCWSLVGVALAIGVYLGVGTEFLDGRKSVREFAMQVDDAVDQDDRLVILDDQNSRLLFYLNEAPVVFDDDAPGFEAFCVSLDNTSETDVLVDADEDDALKKLLTHPLRIERRLSFRNSDYLVLTNEGAVGRARLP